MKAAPLSKATLAFLLLIIAVTAVYSNHFGNSFHFDDFHVIENNVFIRDLSNIPRLITDGATMSVLPTNRSWRPLLMVSLAVDYKLAGGYQNVFFFHLSTFITFLALLAAACAMYRVVLSSCPARNVLVVSSALFMTAWYGLHPVCAETVNYICQRAEVQSTLGVVLGVLLYARYPGQRRYCFYLLPVAVGTLAKPLAIMFGPIIFVYSILFDEKMDLLFWKRDYDWRGVSRALVRSAPSLIACGLLYVLQARMTPESYTPGGTSLAAYLFTQPWVYLYYLRTLFLPIDLTADSDWGILGVGDVRAWAGLVVLALLIFVIFAASRRPIMRPVSFGLAWFLLALAPTTFVPLAEVVNDHRMFFPFIGLVLAVAWPCAPGLDFLLSRGKPRFPAAIAAGLSILILLPYAWGVHLRNEAWKTEESLWKDTVEKSPNNGRALMNYGLIFLERGDYRTALDYFQRAAVFNPDYPTLEVNLGIAYAGLGRKMEAERHFRLAQMLGPNAASSYFYYGRWLNGEGRTSEALQYLKSGLDRVPANFEIRHLLMSVYFARGEWFNLRSLADSSLALSRADRYSLDMKSASEAHAAKAINQAEEKVKAAPSVETYLGLSFALYQAGRFEESIQASGKILEYDPSSADAHNNIASARASLGQWDEAIKEASVALQLRPGFELARNNLNWALSEKMKAGKSVN